MDLTLLAHTLAWIFLGLVVVTTVVPVRTRYPFMALASIDSMVPFGLLGFLFVMAYPDDRRIVALVCIAVAAASEALALVLPTKNVRIERAILKVLATVSGLLSGAVFMDLVQHLIS
ncbi:MULTISPECIES: hypothetical protein [unclassified Rhizobium]|jgi:hypothetical protein|uniref:hypothetical protein n=1 Tax=unclassified Rhizobium TaxID=2613769 RepID=UPI0006473C48|nr:MULTISPECIES: hypothetical protein [unclassified Rhizobium]MBN8952567.1 hypothetical protein [Rhizobium tropici]OJY64562.1 MAG: hypothetical protein BGP09_14355 [Rhizobium sp. 60-20]RKD72591.1 hypothetical protein BJ928_102376 [Rhizobium sp. WW_1]